ncbi:MAG: TonB-dependent receptor [Balneolales bacterium]|nr:TonB-dependent receptor [Balneolales bacterium]
MFLRLVIWFFLLGIISPVAAQNSFIASVINHENEEPLVGVTVFFPELQIGGTTNFEGIVSILNVPDGTHTIRFSFVGFETLITQRTFPNELGIETFKLHHGHEELEEVFVNSTRSSRTIEDSPTRVEFIAGEELSEKGNMKPGDIRMLLNESTGIQTQQTSATSYNSSIRIQGLDGKYTQILRDGFPLYSGYSVGLSLMQIAPLDLKQVEVIKGASSTLYGGGAIAGLVNLITKTPEEKPELSFMLNGTSALGLDASAFYSRKSGKIGTTIFGSYNHGNAYDPSDIGFTAIPEFDRVTLNPKLFLYLEETSINFGFNLVLEDRLGGNLDYIGGNRNSGLYFERNKTERLSTQFQLDRIVNDRISLKLKNSLNRFYRMIEIPGFTFAGTQYSSFSEASTNVSGTTSEWIAGLNLWTDSFDQSEGTIGNSLDFENITFGFFAQNTSSPSPIWTLETGIRWDANDDYGSFVLPRFSLMTEPSNRLTMRLGGGLGYKIPTVFTEDAERLQFRNIQPLDIENLDAEESMGANFDINYLFPLTDELVLSSNILLFYTRIDDPLVLNRTGILYEYIQPEGFVDSKGVEVNLKWSYKDLKLFIGYTYANVEEHYEGKVSEYPLVAEHRLNNMLMYEKHGNFWIGLEAYYFSPQELNDGETGESYWITGLMTEKRLSETFSVFLNFENFLDTRQTDFDTIFTGSLNNPEFRDIYAPVDGFVINGGIKLNL